MTEQNKLYQSGIILFLFFFCFFTMEEEYKETLSNSILSTIVPKTNDKNTKPKSSIFINFLFFVIMFYGSSQNIWRADLYCVI